MSYTSTNLEVTRDVSRGGCVERKSHAPVQRPKCLYAPAASWGFLMPKQTIKPKQAGSRTVRLADVDDATRIREARRLMDDARTIDEFLRLIELAFWPGDAGGRVAA